MFTFVVWFAKCSHTMFATFRIVALLHKTSKRLPVFINEDLSDVFACVDIGNHLFDASSFHKTELAIH
jgi:hypothetical protein